MKKKMLSLVLTMAVMLLISGFGGYDSSVFAASKPGSFTVSAGNYSTNDNIVIDWSSASGADRYGLSVWKPPYGGDQDLVFDQYVNGTSQDIGNLPAGKYRVHMAAYNSEGLTLSNLMFFDVTTPPAQVPSQPVVSQPEPSQPEPSQPEPSKPGDFTVSAGNYSTNDNIVIDWSSASGADRYGLSVWKPPYGGDQDLVFDQYVNGTSQDIGNLPAGKYRVHMAAYNSEGLTMSNLMYFDVAVPQIPLSVPTPGIPESIPMAQPPAQSKFNELQETWFRNAAGAYMNPDGAYGYQCVDVADHYSNAIFPGVGYASSLGGVPSTCGEFFDNFRDNGYYTKIKNNPNDPNQVPIHGDIIFWQNHVAVVDSATIKSVTVIEQNYHNNDGSVPCRKVTKSYSADYGLKGWLSPISQ